MTKSNDKHSDKDLKAYLDGSDGVSATYRKTARAEPPAALDRAILNAAREEVVSKEPEIGGRQMPHMYGTAALAASVMVGVLAASLYFNPQVLVVPVSVPVTAERAVLDERRTESATEERQRSADQARAAPASFDTRQLAPAIPAIGIANPVTAPVPTANDLASNAFIRPAEPEPPTVVFEGLLLEEIEADAAEAQAAAQAQGVADSGALEEIAVTGSRIRSRDDQDYSWRESREDWLAEIRKQTEELERLGRLSGNTVFQERLLQEELDLFMEAYPDADLDAELEE